MKHYGKGWGEKTNSRISSYHELQITIFQTGSSLRSIGENSKLESTFGILLKVSHTQNFTVKGYKSNLTNIQMRCKWWKWTGTGVEAAIAMTYPEVNTTVNRIIVVSNRLSIIQVPSGSEVSPRHGFSNKFSSKNQYFATSIGITYGTAFASHSHLYTIYHQISRNLRSGL